MEDTILVVLFVLFSVGLLSTCVHQVRAQNALTQTFTASIANRRPPETEGIDPETINAFPVVKYSDVKDIKIGKGILECAVCLSEFNDEDLVRLLPECDHVFHPPCIDNWLASHATCPVCRTNLLQAPESHSSALVNDVAIHIDDEDDDRRSTANLISSEGHQIPKIPSPDTMNIRRSHSTGDSRDRRDEGFEKYELRLPEDVKKKILNREEVKQEDRNGAVLGSGEECSRMAYRNVNDQFGRLGRFDRFSISDRFLRSSVKD